jgi:hypothetical protein
VKSGGLIFLYTVLIQTGHYQVHGCCKCLIDDTNFSYVIIPELSLSIAVTTANGSLLYPNSLRALTNWNDLTDLFDEDDRRENALFADLI